MNPMRDWLSFLRLFAGLLAVAASSTIAQPIAPSAAVDESTLQLLHERLARGRARLVRLNAEFAEAAGGSRRLPRELDGRDLVQNLDDARLALGPHNFAQAIPGLVRLEGLIAELAAAQQEYLNASADLALLPRTEAAAVRQAHLRRDAATKRLDALFNERPFALENRTQPDPRGPVAPGDIESVRPLRLWVRTVIGLEPATRIIEGLPMMVDVAFLDEPARPLELKLRSGSHELVLTALPLESATRGGDDDDPDGLWRNVARTPEFVATASGRLDGDPPDATAMGATGRLPTSDDWGTLAGLWRTLYRDTLLGAIEGWAEVTREGNVFIRYQHPSLPVLQQLQLESARIVREQPAPNHDSLSHAPVRSWVLTLRGRGIEASAATAPAPPPARLLLDAGDSQAQVEFDGEQVDGRAGVQFQTRADDQRIRLELVAAENDSVLEWAWSYHADRATGRDASGGGRVGVLFAPDPEDSPVALMAGREAWVRAVPEIVSAVCLDDQLALEPDIFFEGRRVERYRFAPRSRLVRLDDGTRFEDTLGRSGNLTRRVFVVAKGLPPEQIAPLTLELGDNQAVQEYRVLARGRENDPANSRELRDAWTEFRRRVPADAEAGGATEEGVLVLAVIRSAAPPGFHPLVLNGAPASWRLLYGDCVASLEAVRVLAPGAAGAADELEATPRLFVPERFRLAITGRVLLPRDTITVALGFGERPGDRLDGENTLTLRRDPAQPTRYVSGDIDIVRSEHVEAARRQRPGVKVVAAHRGARLRVFPEYDPGFLVLPVTLELPLYDSPERIGRLWQTEVERAARLAGRPVEDARRILRAEASAATNVILTEYAFNSPLTAIGAFRTGMEELSLTARRHGLSIPLASWWQREAGSREGVRRIPISIGDHAAMLLLRRELISMLQEHYEDWERNRAPATVRTIFAAQQAEVGALRSPLSFFRVPLYILPGLGGRDLRETCYLHEVFDDAYVNKRLGVYDRDAIERIRWTAFSHAYQGWGEAMRRAMSEASSIPDSDVKALLALTGHGFEAVVPRLLPQLLFRRTAGGSPADEAWVPDRVARGYVSGLGVLGAAVRGQDEYSEIDSHIAWAAVSIAAIPVGSLGGFWGAMAAFGISAADVAHALYSDWWLNEDRERQLAFEVGAGAVLGYERATEVNDSIVRGWRQALSIGASLLGLGGDSVAVIRAMRLLKPVEILEQGSRLVSRLDFANGRMLRALTPEQRALLVRFVEQAQDAAQAGGRSRLTAAQARVLENPTVLRSLVTRPADAGAAVRPGMAAVPPKPRAIGTPVDTPHNWPTVPRQVNDNTCGVAVARSVIERLAGRAPTEGEIVGRSLATGRGYKTGLDLANGRLVDGGTWPAELIEILNDAGIPSRVPFGRKFRPDGLVPEGGLRPRPTAATIAPDPALDQLRFTLDDAARELREGNQVLAVVDYVRRGGAGESPHWVVIERVGHGPVTREGRTIFNGPYVIIGDPAHGKSVLIPRDDFLRHWKPDASVIATPPASGRTASATALASPPPPRITSPLAPPAGIRPGAAPGWLRGSDPVPRYVSDALDFLRRGDPRGLNPQKPRQRLADLIDACDAYLVRAARGLDPAANRTLFNELLEALEALPADLIEKFVARLHLQRFNGELFLGGRVADYVPPGLDFTTTTNALREHVRTQPYRDPLGFIAGRTATVPPLGRVEADHIFPVAWIVNRNNSRSGLRGFSQLRREYQLLVVHHPANFQPLTPAMNKLKSDLSLDEWDRAVRAQHGRGLSRDYVDWFTTRQEELRDVLQKRIEELLRRQAAEARPGRP
jgi:hypothetical protein